MRLAAQISVVLMLQALMQQALQMGVHAQAQPAYNPFMPLTHEWPTPNELRLASGAPGPAYWQQSVDYDLDVVLDDERQRLNGKGLVTYRNNSPHTLGYLWLQLDQNEQHPHSLARRMESAESYGDPADMADKTAGMKPTFRGGLEIASVTDTVGNLLPHQVVETNLRVDLPKPLRPGETFRFRLQWSYAINNAKTEGRSGYEYFNGDGNYVYEIAQFYPRLCAYDDIGGWQNTPYLGPSEFSLELGNCHVRITVPADHVVAGTGVLQNPGEVLTAKQLERLKAVRAQEGTVDFIITPKEAATASETKAKGTKTWVFQADNVRDFAFASSRRFIWDAAAITVGGKQVLAQSFYPKEGMPLWDKYATHAVLHTLRVYSRLVFDYPYPVATAVHGPVWGMEYPMICFCGGRPLPSGFYSRQTKYLMIGVIMHEVGHNWFPMIVNNDERRWAWMDEGLNSFCQYVAEQEFEPNFPYRRGPADPYAPYTLLPRQQPVMTNPDAIRDNGKISYEKVAVGLAILRDEVMGRPLFEQAIREYSRRWAFRRPEPADFFRTMEDASGMNLDWFWREWFYGTGYVDMAISATTHYKLPVAKAPQGYIDPHQLPLPETQPTAWYIDGKSSLRDKYTDLKQDIDEASQIDLELVGEILKEKPKTDDGVYHVYHVRLKNQGTCIMPLKLDAIQDDGTRIRYSLPAEIWMSGQTEFVKAVYSPRAVVAFHLDPAHALPDVDRANNVFPNLGIGLRFQVHDLRE